MNRWVGLGLLLITIAAWGVRGPQLGLRPMHNDEAVNAIKLRDLWKDGHYVYDPNEHHGPTLYYATLPFVWLSGAPDFDRLSESTLRAVAVFFGLGLILLLWLLADGLGPAAVLVSAALTALSPAMVFYSRYFIHEMLLVCFSTALIGAGWRYLKNPSPVWAALAGASLGLMYATKETFLIPAGAMAGAAGLTLVLNRSRRPPQTTGENRPAAWSLRHAFLACGVAALTGTMLFTSFFTNASGPMDSLRTYLPWLSRAEGNSPHVHPWYFYLERLTWFKEGKGPIWSEGLIVLLALIGAIAAFTRPGLAKADPSLARFLAFYTFLVTAGYSLIAYKTPWCLLGFLQTMILLAGIGAVSLVRACRRPVLQVIAMALILVAAGHLAWEAWRASFPFASDRRNPYVYAQTVPDALKLVQKVNELAQVHPDGRNMLLKVVAPESDYWPLPWYLRAFKRVGWWDRLPADPYAPVMIVGAKLHAALDERSDKAWIMAGFFELRPKTFLELYVKFDLWERYVQSRPRPSDE
jgi:uncharacterized protein (TIGR03663 family)